MEPVKSFSADYIWPAPDVEILRSLFTTAVPGFLPPQRVNATVTVEGLIRLETSYSSLDDFLSQPIMNADRFWVSLNGDAESRSIWFNWNSAESSLSVTGRSGSPNAADTELEGIRKAIEAHLNLKLKTRNRVEFTFTPTSADFDFLTPLLRIIDEITGPSPRFKGTWKTQENASSDTQARNDWLAEVKAARYWTLDCQGRGHRIFVSFEPVLGNVRFEITSWDDNALSQAATRIKSLPGLKSVTDKPQKQGESRRYFLSSQATPEWYEKALGIVLPFVFDASLSPWGRVRRGGKTRGYGDFAAWKAALLAGLKEGDIDQSYFSYFGRDRSLTFDLDHIRDLLTVDVQSIRPSEVEEMHLKFSTELGLKPAPDNAYNVRQWGRTYDIKMPDRTAYAAQLKKAIQDTFSGRRVLVNGTLHLGGKSDEQVKQFNQFSDFLKGLETEDDLREFHLTVTGAVGQFIGVNVEKKLTQLRLQGSMLLNQFQAFAATLKTGLKRMEQSQTFDTDPATGAVQEKKSGWTEKVVIALIPLVGILLGTRLYDAVREPPEVIIDTPVAKDGAAQTQSHDTTISWTYKESHLFWKPSFDGNHEAIVNVRRLSDDKPIVLDEKDFGKRPLTGLEDGSYYVKVDAGQSYKTLVLTVKSEPAPVAAPKPTSPPHGSNHPAL